MNAKLMNLMKKTVDMTIKCLCRGSYTLEQKLHCSNSFSLYKLICTEVCSQCLAFFLLSSYKCLKGEVSE